MNRDKQRISVQLCTWWKSILLPLAIVQDVYAGRYKPWLMCTENFNRSERPDWGSLNSRSMSSHCIWPWIENRKGLKGDGYGKRKMQRKWKFQVEAAATTTIIIDGITYIFKYEFRLSTCDVLIGFFDMHFNFRKFQSIQNTQQYHTIQLKLISYRSCDWCQSIFSVAYIVAVDVVNINVCYRFWLDSDEC